jgi:hypothetical protein
MDVSTTPQPDLSRVLETSDEAVFKADTDLANAEKEYKDTEENIEITNAEIDALSQKMIQLQNNYNTTRSKMIQNMSLKPILRLKMYGPSGFKNSIETDPVIYEQDDKNVDIRGRPTIITRGAIDRRRCAKFNGDGRNYISFPIISLPNYSFCFWVYFGKRLFPSSKKRVVSLTNASNLNNPGVYIDIDEFRLKVNVVSALPGGLSGNVSNSFRVTRGWHHIIYTYDANANNPANPNNKYLAKLYVDGQDTTTMDGNSPYGSGDLMGNQPFEKRPNVLVIGKDFDGHVSDFNYYALNKEQM